jgi:hypothetical protein
MPDDRNDTIAPIPDYFYAWAGGCGLMEGILATLGERISARRMIYHRGTFYSDCAHVITALLDAGFEPFISSEYNWRWWAEELEKKAEEYGKDAQYAMYLPPPANYSPESIQDGFSNLDLVWRYMVNAYRQEANDHQESPMGKVTPAECVKITQRMARWLEKRCYTVMEPVPPSKRHTRYYWPWVEAVSTELRELYQKMGEENVAGGWGPSTPISGPPPWSQPDPT